MKRPPFIIAGLLSLFGFSGGCNLGTLNTLTYVSDVTRKSDISYGKDIRQRLDVYMPTGKSTNFPSGRPVLIFFYGGYWQDGSKDDYRFIVGPFIDRGYVVVLPDYRLYPRVKFPTFLDDSAAAVAWVRDHISEMGGDPNQLFVAGHSAGAYNAVMLALDGQYLAKYGMKPADLRGVVGLAGPYDFTPIKEQPMLGIFGPGPDWSESQPITFAKNPHPPVLLVQGQKDTTVEPANAEHLAVALESAGHPAKLIRYPKLNHDGVLLAVSPFAWLGPVRKDVLNFLDAQSCHSQGATSRP